MSQQILIKRSAVPDKVPSIEQLALGELALNTSDGKLFLKKSVSGIETIVEIGSTTITGDVTGSGNSTIELTLTPTGVTPGSYAKVTVDGKGRVTAGTTLTADDIPSLDWSKITSGKPTSLSGYGITNVPVINPPPQTVKIGDIQVNSGGISIYSATGWCTVYTPPVTP